MLVVANWKMSMNLQQVTKFCNSFTAFKKDVDIIICPSFIHIAEVFKQIGGQLAIGGQDCSANVIGAYTGEVNALTLQESGCRYVIIGHSERRKNWLEGHNILSNKLSVAKENNLKPIYCIGESLEEYNQGLTNEVLLKQLEIIKDYEDIVIAYEPVWAIGTGKTPTMEEIEASIGYIKEVTAQKYYVLYGGSVKPDNANSITSIPSVDGLLVGGASNESTSFTAIVDNVVK